jgi:hypothetical protein
MIADDGFQHEVVLTQVKAKSIDPGDVVIASYEVGDIPNDDGYRRSAGAALAQLKETLERVFPKGVNVVVVATRNGKEDISIKIIKDKTKD